MSDQPATMSENPGLWRGLSFLFSVSCADRRFTKISGPRARVTDWEGRWDGKSPEPEAARQHLEQGDRQVLDDFLKSNFDPGAENDFSFELDLAWNNQDEKKLANEKLKELLPERIVELVQSLPELDMDSISSNRKIEPARFDDLKPKYFDLQVNAIPSTRLRKRKLTVGTRPVRLILIKNGLIAVWHPVEDEKFWPKDHVYWPQNAVPLRSKLSLEKHMPQSCHCQKKTGNVLV